MAVPSVSTNPIFLHVWPWLPYPLNLIELSRPGSIFYGIPFRLSRLRAIPQTILRGVPKLEEKLGDLSFKAICRGIRVTPGGLGIKNGSILCRMFLSSSPQHNTLTSLSLLEHSTPFATNTYIRYPHDIPPLHLQG